MLRIMAFGLALNVALAMAAPAPAAAQGKSKEARAEQSAKAQSKAVKAQGKSVKKIREDDSRGLTTMRRNRELERSRDARDRADDDRRDREREARIRDRDRRDDRDWDRDRDRRDRDIGFGSISQDGKGPKFCRNGEGHPVHGRQWCVQKGFGLGQGSWRATRWDDVVFRRTDRTGSLSSGGLADVLGRVIFGRLTNRAESYGYAQPLTGRWLDSYDGTRTLLVTSGRVPMYELVDRNGDGHVDIVLVNTIR